MENPGVPSDKIKKNSSAKTVRISSLFFTFFKIGSYTIGGGYAMIPFVKAEIVEKKGWINDRDFLDNLAIAQSLPGSIIVTFSLLLGYRLKGLKGGIFSLLGTILPSFLIILMVVTSLWQYQKNHFVQAAFYGLRPAVIALILSAAIELGKNVFRQRRQLFLFILFLSVLIIFNVHPIIVITSGILIGLLRPPTKKKIFGPAKKNKERSSRD